MTFLANSSYSALDGRSIHAGEHGGGRGPVKSRTAGTGKKHWQVRVGTQWQAGYRSSGQAPERKIKTINDIL